MPLEQSVYPEISLRMSRVLALVARRHTQREIAALLTLPVSTVRDYILRAEHPTGRANQRELGRWWEENRKPWLRWLLTQLDIDPRDLTA